MLLAIDIGNTMTDFGFFEETKQPLFYRIRSRRDLSLDEVRTSFEVYLSQQGIDCSRIDGAIISSVVPALTEIYRGLCRALFHVEAKLLGPRLKTGVKINTDNPKEVGADMIAAAVGTKEKYGPCCIVVDYGTANKVFLVDKEGAFAGCAIGAGIGLQTSALSSGAALLPEVSPQIPPHFLGKNTADSMNSALTFGNVFASKGLADAIEKEAGYPCKRILTGGFSSGLTSLFNDYHYEPHLILEGLFSIYQRNQK